MVSSKCVALDVAVQGLLSETSFLRMLGEALKRQTIGEKGERDRELAKAISVEYSMWQTSTNPLFLNLRSQFDIMSYIQNHKDTYI